jgi:hypothetical protein
MWRMLEQLDRVEADRNIPLSEAIKDFALCNSGKGIVVLISDLMDKQGYEAALRFLLAREMDIYVLHVLAPEEIDPEVQGDLRLVDCEDGDIAEITVSRPLLERYKRTLAGFIESAREFCTRRGMSYLMTSTATPIDQIVSGYLRRKGLVR